MITHNKHLIVLVDYFSRWPVAIPVKDLTMKTWIHAFIKYFVSVYGYPERLISDRGGQFIGDLARGFYRYLRVHSQATTAYHPMANGLVERFNHTLQQGLRTLVNENQTDWDEHLDWFLFAYRTSVHPSTQCTPFELVFGQQARVPYDVSLRRYDEPELKLEPRLYLRSLLQKVGENRARARVLSERQRALQKTQYDRNKVPHKYLVGERVWLYHPVVPRAAQAGAPEERQKRKLASLWKGPFVVAEVLSDVMYRLELPDGARIHGIVHANRLRRFVDRADWPDCHPPSDEMQGSRPRLPETFQDLDRGPTLPPVKLVRIEDERNSSLYL